MVARRGRAAAACMQLKFVLNFIIHGCTIERRMADTGDQDFRNLNLVIAARTRRLREAEALISSDGQLGTGRSTSCTWPTPVRQVAADQRGG